MRILRGSSRRVDPGRNRENEKQQPRGLTVESAADMIDSLPSEVPRESQLRIVQEAFAAAGIDLSNLESHTKTRRVQLSTEISLVRQRQKELREKTTFIVRTLEERIRKVQEEIKEAQEGLDAALAEEEVKLSAPLAALEDLRRVGAFFAFPETDDIPEADGEENPAPLTQRVHAKRYGVKGEGFRQA